jgi:hypothetical protein
LFSISKFDRLKKMPDATVAEIKSENTVAVPPSIAVWLESLQGMPPRDTQNPPAEWKRLRELDIKNLRPFSELTPEERREYEEFSDRVINSNLQESLPGLLKAVLGPGFSVHAPTELGNGFQEGKSDVEFTNKLQAAIRQGNPFALRLAAIIYESQLILEMKEAAELRRQGHKTNDLVKINSGYERYYKASDALPNTRMALDALSKKFSFGERALQDTFPTASAVFAAPDRVNPQSLASNSN